jgi:hypothetical protein
MTRPRSRAAAETTAAYEERNALWIATLNACTLGTGDHVDSGMIQADGDEREREQKRRAEEMMVAYRRVVC